MIRHIRRLLLAGIGSSAAILLAAAPAGAYFAWCDKDPPHVLVTPSGQVAVVYLTYGSPIEDQLFMQPADVRTAAAPRRGGGTDVTMTITARNGLFGSYPIRLTASAVVQDVAGTHVSKSGRSARVLMVVISVFGETAMMLRFHHRRGRVRHVWSGIFNTAERVIVFGVAWAVYHHFVAGPATVAAVANLWAVPLMAAAVFALNGLITGTMVAIHRARPDHRTGGLHRLRRGGDGGRGGQARPLHLRALGPGLQVVGAPGPGAEALHERGRHHPPGGAGPRSRQGRDPGLDPAQGGTAHRRRVRGHEVARDAGLRDPGPLPQYREGKELVLGHHERFDGQGYPRGVEAGRVPLGAQIIAVADSLDAMTSDRPYRSGMAVERALLELRRGSGRQWHPEVVAALERLVERDRVTSAEPAGVRVPALL